MPNYDRAGETSPLRRRHAWVLLFLVFGVGLYAAAYLRFFLTSPSGRFPMLDGAENVELARRLATGTLPAAPFYRAMLYPEVLSLFLRAGVPTGWLPLITGLLGCALHLGSCLNIYWLARRAWASRRAGLLAAALFGFNPVAVYFAAEPLDTTLALFLFLAGLNALHASLCCVHRVVADRTLIVRRSLWISGGTFLCVLATLARPHYAIVLAGLPFLLCALLWRWRPLLVGGLAGFVLAAAVGLGSAGLIQKRVCGQFRVMPAQGAYNLWVGNRPGANGRYYEQQIHLSAGMARTGDNPARIESEFLYRRETGDASPLNLESMNNYWKRKTVASIRANPLAWVGLMARKIYYLFNNFEQYNNKTFAVQKVLSPVLRFNPLGWGITFVLCAAGITFAGRRLGNDCPRAWPLLLGVALFYSAGVVMFFVSDRFRLPLLPLLCVGAGVWGCARRSWFSTLSASRLILFVTIVLLCGAVTFSRGWGVYDVSPAIQDYVLLSIAAGKAGEDRDELRWARRALDCHSEHPDALACAVTSFYNLKLQGASPETEFPGETWERQAERVAKIPYPAPGVRLVQGVAFWKLGRPEEARQVWRALVDEPGSEQAAPGTLVRDDALGMLLLTGLEGPGDLARASSRAEETASFYLLAALERRETGDKSLVPVKRRPELSQTEPYVQNIFAKAGAH